MSKRGNNEGSITKRGDGRWMARLSLANGKRKAFYGSTRQEVARMLSAAMRDRDRGLPVAFEHQRAEHYFDSWLAAIKGSVRPRTLEMYEMLLRVHAKPVIGPVALTKLNPTHLQRLYAQKLEEGLSPTSVAHIHAVIHKALDQAEKWGMVPRNVASLAQAPRFAKKEMDTYSQEEVRKLLEAARGDRLEAIYVVAVTTGMRQGELLALRWTDVDLDGATLQVRASLQNTKQGFVFVEPKTPRSRRQISLTKTAIEALRRHHVGQAAERLALGPDWANGDLVFCNHAGGPIDGGNLLHRYFYPLLEKAGLKRIRFHDLRHTAATLLMSQGTHPKVVADMLGHSQIAVTLDLYSHVTPAMNKEAANVMEGLVRSG